MTKNNSTKKKTEHLINLNSIYTQPRSLELAHLQIGEWRSQEKSRTHSGIIALCLNIGTDPPDLIRPADAPVIEAGINPNIDVEEIEESETRYTSKGNQNHEQKSSSKPKSPIERIGKNLQNHYQELSKITRFRLSLDPVYEDLKRMCQMTRQDLRDERLLFHYNGHGVPKPTPSGDIWVFNKSFSQYLPLSAIDLSNWTSSPTIYVWDTSNSEYIINAFLKASKLKETEAIRIYKQREERRREAMNREGYRGSSANLDIQIPNFKHLFSQDIHLGATKAGEKIPLNPGIPTDLFSMCLINPIETAIKFRAMQKGGELKKIFDSGYKLPGAPSQRRSPLGELSWIFTSITDTIAWNVLPRDMFRQLFRQDVAVASLCRNFILADRIMRYYGCHPVSHPKFPQTHLHKQWETWDLELDNCLQQIPKLMKMANREDHSDTEDNEHLIPTNYHNPSFEYEYVQSNYFLNQLDAFDLWLRHGKSIVISHLSDVSILSPSSVEMEIDGRRVGGIRSLTLGAPPGLEPPQELPVILQVLLSQTYRFNSLALLRNFLLLGPWAVDLAYAIGISPFIVRLLASSTNQITVLLILIWAKLVAGDTSCLHELTKSDGYRYFINYLGQAAREATNFHWELEKINSLIEKSKSNSKEKEEQKSKLDKNQTDQKLNPDISITRDSPENNINGSDENRSPSSQNKYIDYDSDDSQHEITGENTSDNELNSAPFLPADNENEESNKHQDSKNSILYDTKNLNTVSTSACFVLCMFCRLNRDFQELVFKDEAVNYLYAHLQRPDDGTIELSQLKVWAMFTLSALIGNSSDAKWLAITYRQCIVNAKKEAVFNLQLKDINLGDGGQYYNPNDPALKARIEEEIEASIDTRDISELLIPMAFHREQRVRAAAVHTIGSLLKGLQNLIPSRTGGIEEDFMIEKLFDLDPKMVYKNQHSKSEQEQSYEQNSRHSQSQNKEFSTNTNNIDSNRNNFANNDPSFLKSGSNTSEFDIVITKVRQTENMLWETIMNLALDGSAAVRREVVNVIGNSICVDYTLEMVRAIAVVTIDECGGDSSLVREMIESENKYIKEKNGNREYGQYVPLIWAIKMYKTLLGLSTDPHLDVMQTAMRVVDVLFLVYSRSCYYMLIPNNSLGNHIINWSTNTPLSGISPPSLSTRAFVLRDNSSIFSITPILNRQSMDNPDEHKIKRHDSFKTSTDAANELSTSNNRNELSKSSSYSNIHERRKSILGDNKNVAKNNHSNFDSQNEPSWTRKDEKTNSTREKYKQTSNSKKTFNLGNGTDESSTDENSSEQSNISDGSNTDNENYSYNYNNSGRTGNFKTDKSNGGSSSKTKKKHQGKSKLEMEQQIKRNMIIKGITKVQNAWINYARKELVSKICMSQILDWEGAYILESDLVQNTIPETSNKAIIDSEKEKTIQSLIASSSSYREKNYNKKWTTKTELVPPTLSPGPTKMAFHPINPHIIVSSQKNTIHVYDYKTKSLVSRYESTNSTSEIYAPIKSLHLVNPNSSTLLMTVSDDGVARVYNSYAPTLSLGDFEQHQNLLSSGNFNLAEFSSPSPELIVAFRAIPYSQPKKFTTNTHPKSNSSTRKQYKGISPNQTKSSQGPGSMRNNASSYIQNQFVGCGVVTDFNQRTGKLYSGADSHQFINIWNLETEQMISNIPTRSVVGGITSIVASSNGNLVVAGNSMGVVRMYDTRMANSESVVNVYRDHTPSTIQSCSFMGSFKNRLYTASMNGKIVVWDVRNNKRLNSFSNYTPNGTDTVLRNLVVQEKSTFFATNSNSGLNIYSDDGNNLGHFSTLPTTNNQEQGSIFASIKSNFSLFNSGPNYKGTRLGPSLGSADSKSTLHSGTITSSGLGNSGYSTNIYDRVNNDDSVSELVKNSPTLEALNLSTYTNSLSNILGNSSFLSVVDNVRTLGLGYNLSFSDFHKRGNGSVSDGIFALSPSFGYKQSYSEFAGSLESAEFIRPLDMVIDTSEILDHSRFSSDTHNQQKYRRDSFGSARSGDPHMDRSQSQRGNIPTNDSKSNLYQGDLYLSAFQGQSSNFKSGSLSPIGISKSNTSIGQGGSTSSPHGTSSFNQKRSLPSIDNNSISCTAFHPYLPLVGAGLEDGSILFYSSI
ncbi:hypothetical protein BB558_003090 [Smittium angustum]|uniref:Raptor N-terminal CASPase-like domain-containing protein n=1 Tax=Smittium angustum TaxID=133377 RepID=A0A2U1J6Z5_SMIAN|nr:hypothetical protein BB558_003090 [Smittium angustum]